MSYVFVCTVSFTSKPAADRVVAIRNFPNVAKYETFVRICTEPQVECYEQEIVVEVFVTLFL